MPRPMSGSRLMKMQTDLSMRTDQRLALMPKMLQSIEVLQMATADLVQLIDEELQQNETLELVRVESEAEPKELHSGFDVDVDGFRRRRRLSGDEDRKRPVRLGCQRGA